MLEKIIESLQKLSGDEELCFHLDGIGLMGSSLIIYGKEVYIETPDLFLPIENLSSQSIVNQDSVIISGDEGILSVTKSQYEEIEKILKEFY